MSCRREAVKLRHPEWACLSFVNASDYRQAENPSAARRRHRPAWAPQWRVTTESIREKSEARAPAGFSALVFAIGDYGVWRRRQVGSGNSYVIEIYSYLVF